MPAARASPPRRLQIRRRPGVPALRQFRQPGVGAGAGEQRRFFDGHLPGGYRLEIVNIGDHVEQARRDQVVASPTLLRLSPLPQRRFIGDMSNTARLCDWLDVAPPAGT